MHARIIHFVAHEAEEETFNRLLDCFLLPYYHVNFPMIQFRLPCHMPHGREKPMSQAREGKEKKWEGKARKTPMRVKKGAENRCWIGFSQGFHIVHNAH